MKRRPTCDKPGMVEGETCCRPAGHDPERGCVPLPRRRRTIAAIEALARDERRAAKIALTVGRAERDKEPGNG